MQSRCAIQRWRFPRQDVITSLTEPGISINLVNYRTEEEAINYQVVDMP